MISRFAAAEYLSPDALEGLVIHRQPLVSLDDLMAVPWAEQIEAVFGAIESRPD